MKTTKLMLIQASLKCPKNQFNKFWNYSYRSCEDILEAVKPLLYETQTTLTIWDEVVEVGWRIYVKATATLKDAETWEIIEQNTAFAREDDSQKGMSDSQKTWSCSSYCRKYCLNWLFLLDDVKDDDATNTHWKEEKTTKKSESKSNPNWWFQKASTNKEFMEKCMDEDNFIRTIKWKYDVDDIVEQQLREAYRNLMWKNEDTVELPFE
jgi:hypothetical protein